MRITGPVLELAAGCPAVRDQPKPAFGGITIGLRLLAGSYHGWAFTQATLFSHHLRIAEDGVHHVAITLIYKASS